MWFVGNNKNKTRALKLWLSEKRCRGKLWGVIHLLFCDVQ